MPSGNPEELARQLAARHGSDGGADTRSPGVDTAEVVSLPLWGSEHYGAPVALLRSALFGVVKRGRRPMLDNQEIESWPDLRVVYTGKRLDQADLDVWLMAVQLHQEQEAAGLGTTVYFQTNPFLRAINRSVGKPNREWLRQSIRRMVEGTVYIETAKREYGGHLIDDFDRCKESGLYYLRINPKLANLYAYGWTRLAMEARLSLGSAQLHKALHGFVLSHTASPKQPLRVGHARLTALYGEGYSRRRDFLSAARKALEDLRRQGLIRAYREQGQVFEIVK